MRILGILAVVSIAISEPLLHVLANSVEAPPNTGASDLEPATMTLRQSTIPGLLVGGSGVGRRQISGECCSGGELHTRTRPGNCVLIVFSKTQALAAVWDTSAAMTVNLPSLRCFRAHSYDEGSQGCCSISYVPSLNSLLFWMDVTVLFFSFAGPPA